MEMLSGLRQYGWLRWLRLHPGTAVGVGVLIAVAVIFVRHKDSEWDDVYIRAAGHLQQGIDIYGRGSSYLYPPFMACLALPFAVAPSGAGRCLWLILNVACLLAMLRWSWRLAGGGRLEGVSANRGERLAAIGGFLCGVFYLQNCLAHQQTDLVIGAALVGGCLLLTRGKTVSAATSFGLAAACKCTALLWAPYLLWRGRPLAAVWLVIVAVGANLLPDLVSASPTGRPWLGEYAHRYLLPLAKSRGYIGTWGSDVVYNQSLAGMGQRWATTSWIWTASDCLIAPRADAIRPSLLRSAVYAIQGVLLLVVLCCCGRPFRRIETKTEGQRQALEAAIVLLLMLLLSPMSSKAHFGTLILPGFCLARAAMRERSRVLWSIVLSAVFLALISNKDPLGERLYTLSLWYGVVTWQTMLLLMGCAIGVRRGSANEQGRTQDLGMRREAA